MHPVPAHRRIRRAAVTAGALLLLASCAGGTQDQPRQSASELAPSPVKKVDRDKQAVEDTITAYDKVVRLALSRERQVVPIRRLRAVVAEPYATKLGRQLAAERSAGIVMRGTDVYTTRSVRVRGDRATLVTCWDPSQSDIVNSYAKPVQKIKPAPATETTFAMQRAGSGWKVAKRTPGKGC